MLPFFIAAPPARVCKQMRGFRLVGYSWVGGVSDFNLEINIIYVEFIDPARGMLEIIVSGFGVWVTSIKEAFLNWVVGYTQNGYYVRP